MAEQGNFAVSGLKQLACLPQNGLRIPATLCSARVWHYTVGTHVVATAHDRDECTHAVFIESHGRNIGIGLLLREQYVYGFGSCAGLPHQSGQIAIGIGTRHNVDQMFLLDQSLAKPFGHTPDHTDQQLFLLFIGLELPQTAENPLLGIVPYGTGIDQNHIRLVQMFRVAVSRILHDG